MNGRGGEYPVELNLSPSLLLNLSSNDKMVLVNFKMALISPFSLNCTTEKGEKEATAEGVVNYDDVFVNRVKDKGKFSLCGQKKDEVVNKFIRLIMGKEWIMHERIRYPAGK
ncbi:hypothetical protein LOAG_12236 [Loa loa]|uniref:Uncharacterized protein n=1 Tax=Loa loa TaxID=7209 RepID=A0A1S0TMR6_LOALO|nr:hypothetical protein LOAG_12236 [Loa loa]EFO16272.1 hypothetical protein LOAG_12236 [Loa loa]